MIACIDASHQHASETLSTIKYAARARNIQVPSRAFYIFLGMMHT
jgi:hypothetical protein